MSEGQLSAGHNPNSTPLFSESMISVTVTSYFSIRVFFFFSFFFPLLKT